MRLGDLLHRDVIRVGLRARTKEEALEEMVDVLVEAHEIPMSLRDPVLDAVHERESHHSTGMQHGVAVPHGHTDRVEDIIAAIGISKEGIPFECLDGISARIIVLLVLPRRTFYRNPHTMAGIAHLLENSSLRDQLKAAADPDAVLRVIKEEESKPSFNNLDGEQ